MTKATKRGLFYSAVVIFILASYIMIFYAQGYKFNFDDFGFYRTGSIHIKTNIGADVYLDDKKSGSTSFLSNSHTINGLLPGEYPVRVQRKDNYSFWEKNIRVEEGLVSEFSKIVLFPIFGEEKEIFVTELESMLYPSSSLNDTAVLTPVPKPTPKKSSPVLSPTHLIDTEPFYIERDILYKNNGLGNNPSQLAVNVKGFSLSQDNSKILYWSGRELWVVWLKKTDYQPIREADNKERIIRLSRPIKKAVWYLNEDWIVADDGKAYKLVEIDNREKINVVIF
ncbi:MAG: hypothetical protein COV30_02115 [Candidatus Yanofskybacteria bacterium CG10_big_fil_rev_8_21_14_0_10_37_15]|uniref:PEGA domain-containing protein n=1 Tax=Candidatus Yanofskybacteria bacterium CG10_big_fil_rev_8_21_14_0_10_37_15 TaxID=1975097 RepID=A0A2H0R5D7_9BACT|nr:MAG: hypothetical protein COV30_02115 [Candidatus Yanofskybacteria bacterium CG10_big_fil_rev_8_21_14_0_10_37_15]